MYNNSIVVNLGNKAIDSFHDDSIEREEDGLKLGVKCNHTRRKMFRFQLESGSTD
jgi:hypothetical protein